MPLLSNFRTILSDCGPFSRMEGSVENAELVELTQLARDLIARINELNKDSGTAVVRLAQATKIHRRWINVILVGFILDIALTIAVAVGGAGIAANNHRIDAVNARLDEAQTTQRAKVLCPLYQLFLDSEKFVPPNQTPEQAANRTAAFVTIHAGYDALDCKNLLHK